MKKMARSLFLIFLVSATVAGAADRPNVLFIAIDDLNHWVTHLGRNQQAKTPNIDKLAARGVTFSRAYCAVPACNPSRAALMSGQRPWTTACYTNGDKWKQILKPGEQLSAQFLKAGYHVAGAGKIYHSDEYFPAEWSEYMDDSELDDHGGVPKNQGFHEPLKMDIQDEDISDWHTVDWCIEQMNEERDEPFFIACGLHKPHLPFAVPRKYFDLFPRNEIELPPFRRDDLDDIPPAGIQMANPKGDQAKFEKSGRWKDAIRSYLATCAYTDMNVGRLLEGLDQSGHRDNTIILLWGDHGWHFGEKHHWRKFALWEEATRAPLVWVVPGMTPKNAVCERTVDFMSLYPTLCDLAKIPIPDRIKGPSIVPLLRDPKSAWDLPAISTHGFMNHAVRAERWRYIRYADGSEELYDHEADPHEWTNLAGAAEHAAIKVDLARWLPKKNAPKRPKKK